MLDEQLISQLKSMLENSQSVLIVISESSSPEEVVSSIGLHLVLRNSGKDSRLVSVKPLDQLITKLPGADQVAQELGNENLTISFDYSEEKVDKVSYHIGEDTKKFYLTIKPKSGHPPLDTSTLEFNYTGASADLIILSGVIDLEELMQLYYGYENVYNDTPIISFGTKHPDNATLQIEEPGVTSSVQWVKQLQHLAFPQTADSATNFLYGVEASTQGLTSQSVNAETFETVANLLRAGAERMYSSKPATSGMASNGLVKQNGSSKKPSKPQIISEKKQIKAAQK